MNELCPMCNTRPRKPYRKRLLQTCCDKECQHKLLSQKAKASQSKLLSSGKHNFQKDESIEKNRLVHLTMKEDGKLYAQSDVAKQRNGDRFRKMNLEANPMWKSDNKERMSHRKTGQHLSESHRSSISQGLTLYLGSLTNDELSRRMVNTCTTSKSIDEFISHIEATDEDVNQFESMFGLKQSQTS